MRDPDFMRFTALIASFEFTEKIISTSKSMADLLDESSDLIGFMEIELFKNAPERMRDKLEQFKSRRKKKVENEARKIGEISEDIKKLTSYNNELAIWYRAIEKIMLFGQHKLLDCQESLRRLPFVETLKRIDGNIPDRAFFTRPCAKLLEMDSNWRDVARSKSAALDCIGSVYSDLKGFIDACDRAVVRAQKDIQRDLKNLCGFEFYIKDNWLLPYGSQELLTKDEAKDLERLAKVHSWSADFKSITANQRKYFGMMGEEEQLAEFRNNYELIRETQVKTAGILDAILERMEDSNSWQADLNKFKKLDRKIGILEHYLEEKTMSGARYREIIGSLETVCGNRTLNLIDGYRSMSSKLESLFDLEQFENYLDDWFCAAIGKLDWQRKEGELDRFLLHGGQAYVLNFRRLASSQTWRKVRLFFEKDEGLIWLPCKGNEWLHEFISCYVARFVDTYDSYVPSTGFVNLPTITLGIRDGREE